MKIIISGYGRMGREVEKIALRRGHQIIAKIDKKSDWKNLDPRRVNDAVVIDFSFPDVVVENITSCFKLGIPVVTGTTGWYDQLREVKNKCNHYDATLFYAPNFSIGVNLFFKANKQLAKLMTGREAYKVSMKETHHIHKLDAPSGTALKAANDIIETIDNLSGWVSQQEDNINKLPIISVREGEVPGTHEVIYESEADKLTLIHEAKNRSGFALGAILAAEFVANKKGIFTMDDLLKF
jgi:4-hydroxy-tetrahydrodipicolinate reductase